MLDRVPGAGTSHFGTDWVQYDGSIGLLSSTLEGNPHIALSQILEMMSRDKYKNIVLGILGLIGLCVDGLTAETPRGGWVCFSSATIRKVYPGVFSAALTGLRRVLVKKVTQRSRIGLTFNSAPMALRRGGLVSEEIGVVEANRKVRMGIGNAFGGWGFGSWITDREHP